MKSIISFGLAMAFVFSSSFSFSQNSMVNDQLENLSKLEDVTVVDLSPQMFELAGSFLNGEKAEVENIVKKITQMKVISTKSDKSTIAKNFSVALDRDQYEDLIRVKDKTENVRISMRSVKNKVSDIVIFVQGVEEITIVKMGGNFDLDEIKNLLEESSKPLKSGKP